MKQARITLVGAGPGDPELMTLKGLKALQSADVVMYDALVNPTILQSAPKQARKIFVGKRAGKHSYKQETINQMLVSYALNYGHVVRLKGGDPFIFGRGHEEIDHAAIFDIPTEVVPGISSCISVPELQKVPLTRRGISESFWVMTGTTKQGQLSNDVALAAQSTATVVILMGMRKLSQIAALFSAYDRQNTPVMVVQNGSRSNEKVAIGHINNIVEEVEREGLGSPGIIVIGNVVATHPAYCMEYLKAKALVS